VYRSYKNSSLTLTGKLDSSSGVAATGITVTAWGAPLNSTTFTKLASTTTDSAGHWALYTPKGVSRALRVEAAGALPSSTSGVVTVTERVLPSMSLSISSHHYARLTFSGYVTIAPLGTPGPRVQIEVHSASGWQDIGTPVRVGSNGGFSYHYTASTLLIGHSFAFRAMTPATYRWQAGLSPVEYAVIH
jgi:hypothetical protein